MRPRIPSPSSIFRLQAGWCLILLVASSLLMGCVSTHPTLPVSGPDQDAVNLAFLGDVMFGRGIARVHASGSWETALAPLAPTLSHVDLSLANLESPLTTAPLLQPGSTHNLRADPQAVEALQAAGVDMLSLANNHSMDYGFRGLEDTREALFRAGLTPIGPGPSPVWRTIHGLRLAFLALEDISHPLELETASRSITSARESGGLVVASVHWGNEFQAGPSQRQRNLAQWMADAGVSLIWGHHPHVLQPIEWIQGKGQPHPTLVAYSLGNALFDQISPPAATQSILLIVRLGEQGVESYQAIPIQIDVLRGQVHPAP